MQGGLLHKTDTMDFNVSAKICLQIVCVYSGNILVFSLFLF